MNAISDLNRSSITAPNPSTYVDNFLNTLNDLYCNFFPLCSKLISKKRLSKPWITPTIWNLIKQKSNAFQLYRRGLISVWQNNLIKKITSAIYNSKREYYRKTFQKFRINMHETWSTVTSMLQTSQNKNITKAIFFNNVEVTDEFEITNLFIKFFTGVCDRTQVKNSN